MEIPHNSPRTGNKNERNSRVDSLVSLLTRFKTGELSIEQTANILANDEAQVRMFANEVKEHATNLEGFAYLDSLTKAYTRRGLEEKMKLIDESRTDYSILIFDIDHFKIFNDTYGHDAGDEVLKSIVSNVSGQLRNPGKVDLLCRWGGEEFVVVLPEVADSKILLSTAERIRVSVQDMLVFINGGPPLKVTISVGGQINSESILSFGEVVGRADTSLYEAKKSGRNRVIVAQ